MASLREHLGLPLRIFDAAAGQLEVFRIDLYPDKTASVRHASNASSPAPHERVAHHLPFGREQADKLIHEAARLLRRVLIGRASMPAAAVVLRNDKYPMPAAAVPTGAALTAPRGSYGLVAHAGPVAAELRHSVRLYPRHSPTPLRPASLKGSPPRAYCLGLAEHQRPTTAALRNEPTGLCAARFVNGGKGQHGVENVPAPVLRATAKGAALLRVRLCLEWRIGNHGVNGGERRQYLKAITKIERRVSDHDRAIHNPLIRLVESSI